MALPPDLVERIEPLLNSLGLSGVRPHALKGDRRGSLSENCPETSVLSSASKTATLMMQKWWTTAGTSHGCR